MITCSSHLASTYWKTAQGEAVMAYLDVPRLHFVGRFYADPSTIDNNANNFRPNPPLSEDPNSSNFVLWNAMGTHTFQLRDCVIKSGIDKQGNAITTSSADPVIGANLESVLDRYKYVAKLVDLDVDQQGVSQ